MHCKHVLKLKTIAGITVPTIAVILVTSFLLLIPVFSQSGYSQFTTGNQNLSSFLNNILQSEKSVSGHYSNPQFGIDDIAFPDGWHGIEIPSIEGLMVTMHPGNQSESLFTSKLLQPQIILQVINNSDLASFSSEGEDNNTLNPTGFSVAKICKPLAQNSTSVIDGKVFNVATVECPFSSLMGSSGISTALSNQSNFGSNDINDNSGGARPSSIFKSLNPNAVMQTKLYEFKGSDKTYRLAIVVSNLFSSNSEKPDISKYTQLIDTTANTLKFK